jgi:PAS domain S-box-containing protein
MRTLAADRACRKADVDDPNGLLTSPPLRELAAEDPRFRAIVGVSFDAYYDWDIRSGDNYFSEYFDEMLGQPRGSARRWFYAWAELVHPDDKVRVLRSLSAAFRHDATWKEDYRLRRADGTYVWVQDTGVIARDDAGRPARMLGTIRDVTHEREAGRALEAAAELHRTLFRGPPIPPCASTARDATSRPTRPPSHTGSVPLRRWRSAASGTTFPRRSRGW